MAPVPAVGLTLPGSRSPRVVLVAMPWMALYRPALGISLLKAALRRRGIATDIRYLNIVWAQFVGPRLLRDGDNFERARRKLSEHQARALFQLPAGDMMAAEWIFARHVFGNRLPDDSRYLELLRRPCSPQEVDLYRDLAGRVDPFLQHCLQTVPWQDYDVVGLTSSFQQNLASLCLARLLRQRHPRLQIVMGGANCEGGMGEALLRNFEFLDYVVGGEADETFPELVECIGSGRVPNGIPGVVWRRDGVATVADAPPLVANVDSLPTPEFDDFFEQVKTVPFAADLALRLPLQQSRGCWWGQRKRCRFCALNGRGVRYRAMSVDRAWDELQQVTRRHGVTTVDFADNILNLDYFGTLLPRLAESGNALSLFYEIKSNVTRPQVELLRQAGVVRVQPGIETLSSRLLRLMNKGCTLLQNVQCLKWCFQYGIQAQWNLLYGFPGETKADYRGVLAALARITHLAAPAGVNRIRMDRYSPYFEEAERLGFRDVRPAAPYAYLYPLPAAEIAELAYSFEADLVDVDDPDACVAPVRKFVERWRAQSVRGRLVHAPLPGGGAVIEDTRFNWRASRMTLDQLQNDVYVFCDEARSFGRISKIVTRARVAGLRGFLDRLVRRGFMVRDDDRYLSVAPVRATSTSAPFDDAARWQAISA